VHLGENKRNLRRIERKLRAESNFSSCLRCALAARAEAATFLADVTRAILSLC
jgi:hypothetical protein